MNTKAIAVAALFSMPLVAGAGPTSALIVVATGDAPRVAASLRQRADYLAAPISLRSDRSDPAERFVALGNAKAALMAEVAKQKGWLVHEGGLSLSGRSGGKFSSFYTPQSRSDLTILVPLGEGTDAFQTAAAVIKFVGQQSLPRVEINVGNIELAVREPQQYRPQLLKLIAEEAARTRDGIAAGAQTKLEGLESPVLVRQVNTNEVELFMDYKLSVEKR